MLNEEQLQRIADRLKAARSIVPDAALDPVSVSLQDLAILLDELPAILAEHRKMVLLEVKEAVEKDKVAEEARYDKARRGADDEFRAEIHTERSGYMAALHKTLSYLSALLNTKDEV
jgi:hypothetical protein